MRAFIAVDIPKKIKKEVVKIQNSLPEFKGKKTEQENLHLTLKFLGEVNQEALEKVKNKLKSIKFEQFETEIDSIGTFNARIVWLHMAGCEELQRKIDGSLKGLFLSEKRFMSHLTIARVKEIKDKKSFLKELGKIKFDKIGFEVKEFKLKISTLTRKGPAYEDLEVYNLK